MSSRSVSKENLVACRFAAIAQASNILVVILDKRGRIKFFNRGCEEATGYSSEELIRKSFVARLIPRSQQKAVRQQFRDFLATSSPTRTVIDVETKAGILRTIEWTHTTITDDEGNLREIISVGQDITDVYVEEPYKAIIEQSPQALIILQEGCIVFANPAASDLSGYSVEELLSKSAEDILTMLHPEDREIFQKRIQERLSGAVRSADLKYRFTRKDGEQRWIRTYSATINYRGQPAIQVSIVDITERELVEHALRESQEFASTILDWAPNPILVVNPDTSIRYANAALEELIGLDASEIIGLKPPFPWWKEDWSIDARQTFAAMMKIGFQGREAPIRIKDGETGWVEITSTPVMVDGELKYYISNWVDTTKRKRAEAALKESEALYRSVVESTLLAVTIRQGDRFVFANAAAAAIHGRSVEELLALTPEDMIATVHPEDLETALQRHEDRMAGKPISNRFDVRLVRKDGTVRWTEAFSTQIKYKGALATHFHTIDITERKLAEAALRESEAKYRAVVEGVRLSITIRQGDRLVYANNVAATLYGYSVEELCALSYEQLIETVHPEDRVAAIQRHKDRMAGKPVADSYEYRMIRRDGSIRWLEIYATQIEYQDTPATQFLGIDITSRREAEASLRESEARYRELFDRVPVGLYRSTPEGQIVDANPAMMRLLGYPDRESILRANAADFYADQTVRQQWQRLMVEKGMVRDFLVQMRRQDGKLVWAQDTARVIIDAEGKVQSYEGSLIDVTEQTLTGEALRESEAKYRKLVEQSLQGIVITQGIPVCIVYTNPAFSVITGYTEEELLAMTAEEVRALVYSEDQELVWERVEKRMMGESVPQSYEYRIVHKRGAVRWVQNYASRIEYQGRPAIQTAISDITDSKVAEENLRESETKYRDLVEQSLLGIIILQENPLRISFVNEAAAKLIGYSVDEAPGLSPQDIQELIYSGNRGDAFRRLAARFRGEEVPPRWELRMVHRDGSTIWVDMASQSIEFKGEPAVQTTLVDISERKQSEELIRIQRDLGISLAATSDLQIVLKLCLETTIEASEMDCGGVYLVNEVTGDLELVIHQGLSPSFLRHASYYEADSPNAQLVMKGTPVYLNYEELPVPSEAIDFSEGLKALAVIPISHENRVIGCLNVSSHSRDVIPVHARTALELVAAQIGTAIARARVEQALRESESALRESEERFRKFFENAPEYCYMISPEGVILSANQAALKALEYTKDELVGQPLRVVYAPETLPKMQRLFTQWSEEGELRDEEMVIISKKGIKRTVLLSASAVRSSEGQILYSVSIQVDITERMAMEAALKRERDLAQQYLDIAGVILVVLDTQERVILINRKGCEVLGVSEEEILGKNWFDNFLPERLRQDVKQMYAQLMTGEVTPEEYYENPILTKQGEERLIAWHNVIFRDEEENILGFLSSGEDITERREVEAALRESHQFNQQIIDNAYVGIAVLDQELKYQLWNPFMEQITGIPAEEVLGKFSEGLFPRSLEQDVLPLLQRALTGEIVTTQDTHYFIPLTEKSGWYTATYGPLRSAEGEITGVLSFMRDITDRKEAEASMLASEQRYRSLFEEAPISLWEEDLSDVKHFLDNLRASGVTDFRAYLDDHPEAVATCTGLVKVIDVNKATLELYHAINKEDFIHNLEQVFCEESYPVFQEQLITIAEGKTTFSSEAITQNLTGEKNHIVLKWTVAPGYEETWGKLLVSIVDISEQKAMERALQESEAKLRSVTEHSPDQILLLDQELRILFINRTTPDTAKEEILGRSVLDFTSPDFQQVASDCYQRVWETGKPDTFYTEYRPEEGEVLHFEVRVAPILESGRVVALVSISTDITARKEAERAVRESETKYRSFVENFLGIAYRSRPDYSIEFFHGAVQSITGYAEEDFVSGRVRWDRVIHPDDWARLQKGFNRMGRVPGAIGELEYRIIRKDGGIRWLHDNMRGLYSADYQVTAIEGILIDITERKEAEDAAFEAWARAEFFNDLMVHDLTNIHQAILSLLELVLLDSALPSQAREFVQTALAQLVRSSDLISKVKKFALIDSAPLTQEQRDLSEPLFAAADAIRDSYPQRKLHIRTLISPGKYYAPVDEFLYDMFFNLLHNAMRYDRRDEVHVDILVEQEREFLKIRIQDRGPGIADGDKEQIFARLSSRERGKRGVRGRGIGLTLVQRIVTRYRGKIWVEDRVPGDHSQGASFVVLLPRGDTE